MSVNEPLLRECIAVIEASPEKWSQVSYEFRNRCGTTWCLAGWAIMLSYPNCNSIYELHKPPHILAKSLLALTDSQAYTLFLGGMNNDLNDFKSLITEVTGVEFKPDETTS